MLSINLQEKLCFYEEHYLEFFIRKALE